MNILTANSRHMRDIAEIILTGASWYHTNGINF